MVKTAFRRDIYKEAVTYKALVLMTSSFSVSYTYIVILLHQSQNEVSVDGMKT